MCEYDNDMDFFKLAQASKIPKHNFILKNKISLSFVKEICMRILRQIRISSAYIKSIYKIISEFVTTLEIKKDTLRKLKKTCAHKITFIFFNYKFLF